MPCGINFQRDTLSSASRLNASGVWRNPRRSPEPHAFQRDPAVPQVMDFPEQLLPERGFHAFVHEGLAAHVVVAGDKYDVLERQALQPCGLLLQLAELAEMRDVPAVDENIPRRAVRDEYRACR